ncbi:unnamed protein product [Orchesella dallaii]|uniref:Uncharacterized protein n=1 Tax=Orchesella dallaii TaxID=48710 RepID=A0ABP1Q9U3_9HEXA
MSYSPRKTRTQGKATDRDVNKFLDDQKKINKIVAKTKILRINSDSALETSYNIHTRETEVINPNTSEDAFSSALFNEATNSENSLAHELRLRHASAPDIIEPNTSNTFNQTFAESSNSEASPNSKGAEQYFSADESDNDDLYFEELRKWADYDFQNDKTENTVPISPLLTISKMTATSITYTPPGANQIFDGSSSVTEFFDRYDNYATVFSWNDDVKLSQLRFHLSGPALKAYKLKLAEGTTTTPITYQQLKKHIQDSFTTHITAEEYRRRLLDRRKDIKG